jgi:hypothetical protein
MNAAEKGEHKGVRFKKQCSDETDKMDCNDIVSFKYSVAVLDTEWLPEDGRVG